MPPKLIHRHEKISDAELIAVAVLQRLHKVPYFSRWWRFLKLNHFPSFHPRSRREFGSRAVRDVSHPTQDERQAP